MKMSCGRLLTITDEHNIQVADCDRNCVNIHCSSQASKVDINLTPKRLE
jgi:hypothetical protein